MAPRMPCKNSNNLLEKCKAVIIRLIKNSTKLVEKFKRKNSTNLVEKWNRKNCTKPVQNFLTSSLFAPSDGAP